MNFVYIRQIIEGNNTTDREIKQAAARLRVEILNGGFSDDISYEARCWVNGICQELNNAEQRAAAGFEPIHQQVMIGRWTNLLKFLLDGLQGVSIIYEPGDAALKYFERHRNPSTEAIELPKKLDTAAARQYFAKAVKDGLMSEQYKWLASQGLLACFAREMSLKLELNKAKNSDGSSRISWQPFEVLFGYERGSLKQSLADIKKTGQNPLGIEKVNAIFPE